MSELLNKIKVLKEVGSLTKQEKIVKGIIECIVEDKLSYGDILPSVNELSKKLGYSRETVVKSYKALKERGIVKSKHGLGFFIANNDVEQKLKVALVLYGFQTFQQDFYNKFRKTLGDQYQIDVYFHHNNIQMYQSILNNIKLKYGRYVIAPIQSEEAQLSLSEFPKDKLLIIDRYQYLGDEVSHISQEFEMSLSLVFEDLKTEIKKFKSVILFFRNDVDYPAGIYSSFLEFCNKNNIEAVIHKEYETKHLEKDRFYFTVGDTDLWLLLKDAKDKNLELGTDIGILSHNDSPVKEIIQGGITTFSTDFKMMAQKAAQAIISKKTIKEIVPCLLIRRKSI